MKLKINKELELTIMIFIMFLLLITTILNYKWSGILAILIILFLIIYKFTETDKKMFKN